MPRTPPDQAPAREHPCFARIWAGLGGRIGAQEQRLELLQGLAGRVLEVGAGDGRNFALYPRDVREVVAVEPEPYLRERAIDAARRAGRTVTVLDGRAEALPLIAHSFDAAVTSLVLCSVEDQTAALGELRRVLRSGGELRFFEHVVADPGIVRSAQRALDRSGLWPRLGGGCHLSRDTLAALRAAGFRVEFVRRVDIGAVSRAVPLLLGRARLAEPHLAPGS
jgi:ubiquinone/menaquinone biosynthesis C-methylase UbiE